MPARISTANRKTKRRRRSLNNNSLAQKITFWATLCFLISIGVLNIYTFKVKQPQVIVINTQDDSFVFWENISRLNPTYKDAYIIMARLQAQEGKTNEAEELFNKALSVDPFIPDSL